MNTTDFELANNPECGRCLTLMVDALDGELSAYDDAIFRAHRAGCSACEALFDDAQRGRQWLSFADHNPQIPSGLVERILSRSEAATHGFGSTAGGESVASEAGIASQTVEHHTANQPRTTVPPRPNVDTHAMPNANPSNGLALAPSRGLFAITGGLFARFVDPRLMMTAAMAFFSIALTLHLAGFQLGNGQQLGVLRLEFLRPEFLRLESWMTAERMQSMMERRLMTASTPLIRTYDHVRSSYAVESKVRLLRRTSEALSDPNGDTPHVRPQGTSQTAPEEPAAKPNPAKPSVEQQPAGQQGACQGACDGAAELGRPNLYRAQHEFHHKFHHGGSLWTA